MVYPARLSALRSSYTVYEDLAGLLTFGTAEAVASGTHVLVYRPMRPTSEETFTEIRPEAMDPLVMRYITGTTLKPIKNAKFPHIVYDRDTDDVLLHYWTNVPYTNLSGDGSPKSPYTAFSLIETSEEPISSDGSEVTDTLRRIMVCARGSFYDLYDNGEGTIKHRRHLIFERPQWHLTPAKWVNANNGEPMIDTHAEEAS